MANSTETVVESRDLNDLFDSIVCLESSTLEEGRADGLREGREESTVKGFVIGINTGSSISIDLGYSLAFCTTILDSASNPNIVTLCTEIIDKVKSFPTKNLEHDDMVTKAGEIKSQMERVKTAMKKHFSDNSVTVTTRQKFSI